MAKPAKWGDEFLVNRTTKEWQTSAAVTGLTDGRFAVAWEDTSETGGDTSSAAIRAQLFNADGSRFGGEFLVNTTTASLQYQPSIAKLANGRFAVTWTDLSGTGGDTSGAAIRGQVFNADGSRAGAEFLVNTATDAFQDISVMAPLTDGRFVVAWSDVSGTGGDTSSWAVRAQVFNSSGSKSGGEILVNTSTAGAQLDPSIAGLSDGRFVAAWQDEPVGVDTDGDIRAQIFNSNGSKSGIEFAVNATTTGEQYDPAVTALAAGRFVVTWTDSESTGGDTSGDALRGQVFNANGSTSGVEFLINTTTGGDQRDSVIATLADGRFVVAWFDASKTDGDKSKGAVRAQVFETDGSRSGKEFLVNTTTDENQALPTISVLADGRFVIAWTDFSQHGADKSESALRAQIFDPRVGPVSLVGTAAGEDFVGTAFKDALDGGAGDDTLNGARGSDVLTGGLGADRFVFDVALNKKAKADAVTDFAPVDDTIVLDKEVFSALGKKGVLKAKFFHEGKKAHDGNDRVIYDGQSGKVTFDRNGDDKGGTTKFAVLGAGLDLSSADFLVV